jgi:hypothetical protein
MSNIQYNFLYSGQKIKNNGLKKILDINLQYLRKLKQIERTATGIFP